MLRELDDLEHHLDLALKGSLVGASSEEKAAALAQVTRILNKADALDASTLHAFEATAEHRAEGHGSPVDWLKHHSRAKGPAASRGLRLSRWLSSLPMAHEALVDGAISAEHVEVLARAQKLLGDEVFAELEEGLVDAARTKRFSDFERTVDYWVVRVAPADAAERERRQVEGRGATSSRGPGGVGRAKAEFDPLSFVPWQAELDRIMDHELQKDRAEARDRLGRAPLASELRRTARQRRLDAMRIMAERSAKLGDVDLGPAPISVVVHGDVVLLGRIVDRIVEVLGGDGLVDLGDLAYEGDSLHELEDGTVVTVNTILLGLLTGTVRGILYDPDGVPLRFGRERRLFSGEVRQAIRARFRRCAHPFGCDRTGPHLESDHVHEWDDGGRTDIDNGQGLCHPHNIWKTNHRHDPPPDDPDRSHRRTGPDAGPPPHNLGHPADEQIA